MEDTLNGIKAYVEAELLAELQVIEAERDVTIPEWRELKTTRVHAQAHPLIEILPGTIDYDYQDSGGPLPVAVEYHTVTVRVFQVRTAANDALADVMRYAEGFRRITIDDDTYGARFHDVRLVSATFSEAPDPQNEAAPHRDLVEIGLRVQVLPR